MKHLYLNWSLVTKQSANNLNQGNEEKSNACQLCQVNCICTKGPITCRTGSNSYTILDSVKHQTNERQPLQKIAFNQFMQFKCNSKTRFEKAKFQQVNKILTHSGIFKICGSFRIFPISNLIPMFSVYTMKSDCKIVLLLNDEYLYLSVYQI